MWDILYFKNCIWNFKQMIPGITPKYNWSVLLIFSSAGVKHVGTDSKHLQV